MLIRATAVIPSVNQIELHPYFQQTEQRRYNAAHGIISQAWSPLGRANQMLRDETIQRIAHKHGVTEAQTVLRWHLQIGDVSIPKSLHAQHQRENLSITGFELDEQDMHDIALMDNPEGRCKALDPHWHEEM